MAKNDNKNFSLPTIKDLEIYFDLIKKKDISELEIETDQIRIKIVSENKNIKFSTQQTASEIINHSQSAELNNQKISKELAKPPAKNYIAELVKQRKLKEIENKKNAKSFLLITFCTLLLFNVLGRCTSNFNKNRKKSELKLLICRTPKKDLGICYARDEVKIL